MRCPLQVHGLSIGDEVAHGDLLDRNVVSIHAGNSELQITPASGRKLARGLQKSHLEDAFWPVVGRANIAGVSSRSEGGLVCSRSGHPAVQGGPGSCHSLITEPLAVRGADRRIVNIVLRWVPVPAWPVHASENPQSGSFHILLSQGARVWNPQVLPACLRPACC
jgi:hypothetical protein